jgi:cell division protease FtsH
MQDMLAYALGGRAAEELVFHEPTTGASNDIEKATKLARSMVTEYGMSSKLGAVKYGTGDAEPFMGRDYGHQRDYSEDIAADIDAEVRSLIEGAHDEAWEILVQYRDALDALVAELIEKETLTKDDLERILAPVRKRPPHNTFSGFGKRTPSDRPPIEVPPSVRVSAAAIGSNGSASMGSAPMGSEPSGNGANGAHRANLAKPVGQSPSAGPGAPSYPDPGNDSGPSAPDGGWPSPSAGPQS